MSPEAEALAVRIAEAVHGATHGDKFDALSACLYALGVPPTTDRNRGVWDTLTMRLLRRWLMATHRRWRARTFASALSTEGKL